MKRKEFIGSIFGASVMAIIPWKKERSWVATTINANTPTMIVVTPDGIMSVDSGVWKDMVGTSTRINPDKFMDSATPVPEYEWTNEQRQLVNSVRSWRNESSDSIAKRIDALVEGMI
jgi:hypothetical protein